MLLVVAGVVKHLHLDFWKTQHLFNQQRMRIPESTLLLDNKLTVNYICNPNLITNIHCINKRCIISTNTRTSFTNHKVTLKSSILGLGEDTRFDLNGIANIIALHIVQSKFSVDYTNWKGPTSDWNKFIVYQPGIFPIWFKM